MFTPTVSTFSTLRLSRQPWALMHVSSSGTGHWRHFWGKLFIDGIPVYRATMDGRSIIYDKYRW
ncbi:MAG: hypothetical protein U5L72_09475 [Bacteroidales bacterium]|nr:hypothetical protein [Bacteroidales bacterium]